MNINPKLALLSLCFHPLRGNIPTPVFQSHRRRICENGKDQIVEENMQLKAKIKAIISKEYICPF